MHLLIHYTYLQSADTIVLNTFEKSRLWLFIEVDTFPNENHENQMKNVKGKSHPLKALSIFGNLNSEKLHKI